MVSVSVLELAPIDHDVRHPGSETYRTRMNSPPPPYVKSRIPSHNAIHGLLPTTHGGSRAVGSNAASWTGYVQYRSRPYPTDLGKLDPIDDWRGKVDMPLQSPVVGLFRLRLV